jgi:hypothetical protein
LVLGALAGIQLVPEFVEVYIRSPDEEPKAASLVPSAEHTKERQKPAGPVVTFQVEPEFVDADSPPY